MRMSFLLQRVVIQVQRLPWSQFQFIILRMFMCLTMLSENDSNPILVSQPVFAGVGSNLKSTYLEKPMDFSSPNSTRKSGLANSFSILGQVTEGFQTKERGYLVRDRKLTQRATESKNQAKKKKSVIGTSEEGGTSLKT